MNTKKIASVIILISIISVIFGCKIYNEKSKDSLILAAVLANDIESTKFLIKQGFNINSRYKHNHTLLLNASLYGDIRMVRLLVENNAKLVKNDFDLTAIDNAKEFKDTTILEYLTKNYKVKN